MPVSRRRWLAAAAAVLVLVAAWLVTRRSSQRAVDAGGGAIAPANILIISADTLRADRLSSYGYDIQTPAISRLAREGVQFNYCFTPVPLTLPAHVSIFTGLLPLTHGVRDNGGFYLERDRQTLAELLKPRGYATAAFVSAFVLDSRWGLDQGFDRYFDDFSVSADDLTAMARIQRPASETWAEAGRWLREHASDRFFVWVHLFDPHTPYASPEPFRTRYSDRPYDGEVAYVDSVVAEILSQLEATALLEKTLVVFLSDHGEGLGQHDEDEHGLLTYDSTLHVPWIMRLPDRRGAGAVVNEAVSLVDVLPTVLELGGHAVPAGIDGMSRARLVLEPNAARGDVVYAESYYPRLRFGWSELVSVRDNRFKLIRASNPELYEYRKDPQESSNVAREHPTAVTRLNQILNRLTTAQSSRAPHPAADAGPDAANRLRALGYFAGSALPTAVHGELADPKDKTKVYRALTRARELLERSSESEGLGLLQQVVHENPDLEPAHRTLREYWIAHRKFHEARAWLQTALARRPGDARLLVDLAAVERATGRLDAARAALTEAISRRPDDAEALVMLGEVLRDGGRHEDALVSFARAEEHSPTPNSVRMQTARTLIAMRRLADAESSIDDIVARDPHTHGAYYLRAQIAEQRRDPWRAESEYRKEVAETPWDYQARFNLAVLLGERGEHRERLSLLESIPELAPGFADVFFHIAKAILDAGETTRFPDAVAAAQRGLALAPTSPSAPLGHYVLADIYRLQDRRVDAERELQLGRELEQRIGGAQRPRSSPPR